VSFRERRLEDGRYEVIACFSGGGHVRHKCVTMKHRSPREAVELALIKLGTAVKRGYVEW
jgi:hypothetical protein